MSASSPKDPDRVQTEFELRASSTAVWKCISAILAGFVCSGGVNYYCAPGIFLLIWAAVTKQYEISAAMSDHLDLKRKRSEDGSATEKSENPALKKQRETGNFDTAASNQKNGKADVEVGSLRSILVTNISEAQATLDAAQLELEKWDAAHQNMACSDPDADMEDAGEEQAGEDGIESEHGSNKDGEEKEEDEDEDEDEAGADEDADDELWMFREVLNNIHLDKLPELASRLRQNLQLKDLQDPDAETPDLIDCVVQEKPLSGSFNILWVVEFSDGVKWLLKVPETATHDQFDQFAANRMESEVRIMRMVKNKTTIPLPTIYAHDITFDNAINCPYVMMEMLEGRELFYSWFDKDVSEEELEERRARTLRDLARMMNQLRQFQYEEGGSLLFDGNGNPSGIGPLPITDDAPFLLVENEGKDYGKIHEVGPFSDPVKFFTRKLDLHKEHKNEYTRATDCLLRLFISLLPQGSDPKFVLKHPDYDSQNILVAADGSVTGIIDWDRARVGPQSNGNEAYPLWLMDDWDSAHLVHEPYRRRNTDVELSRYRRMYMDFLTESKLDTESALPGTANMTKVSLLANCLDYASCRIGDADEALWKIMRELTLVAAHDTRAPEEAKQIQVPLIGFLKGEEEEPHKVAMSLAFQVGLRIDRGTISEDEMGWIRDGVAALCS